jgi:nucleotide-binding universal stress UspA family protein
MSKSSTEHGILVGVDGSPESDAALRWAAGEAVLRGVPITLMHVIPPIVVSWPVRYLESSYVESQEEYARHVVEQAQKTLLAILGDSGPPVKAQVGRDGIVTELADASADATMVVVGSRGLGPVGGAVLGSVSRSLLHHAHCPIAVIKADAVQPAGPTSPVLLGIDGSTASEAATAFAFDAASRRKVDLVALHAWSDVGVFPVVGMDWHEYEDEGHEVLAERLAGWQEQYPDVHVRRRIVCDRPARWLIDESKRALLVVVGSRGRGGIANMLLGSVSTAVAESAAAPVVVVRGKAAVDIAGKSHVQV